MNNFQFISYTPTPNDQYMLGIAKIKAYGKIELRLKHIKSKDGAGSFFCSANYITQDAANEKKYISCFQIDSRTEEENLLEVIREGVDRVMMQRNTPPPTQAAYYPHGMVQTSAPIPATSTSEVAMNEQLPF